MKKRQGLTLIELLVTLAIMGLLLAVGTIGYRGSQKKQELKNAATELTDVIERTKQYSLAPRRDTASVVCFYYYNIRASDGQWHIYEFTPKNNDATKCTESNPDGWRDVESGKISDESMIISATRGASDPYATREWFFTYKEPAWSIGAGDSYWASNFGAYTITVKYAGMTQELKVNAGGGVEWL